MARRRITNKALADELQAHPTGISRIKTQDVLPEIGGEAVGRLKERDRLPKAMGAFLVTDFAKFAYVGSSSNLNKRFADQTFIKELNQIKANKYGEKSDLSSSDIQVIWIECNNFKVISRIEQELLAQFHHLILSKNSLI